MSYVITLRINQNRCLLQIRYTNFQSHEYKIQLMFLRKYYTKLQNAGNVHLGFSPKSVFQVMKSSTRVFIWNGVCVYWTVIYYYGIKVLYEDLSLSFNSAFVLFDKETSLFWDFLTEPFLWRKRLYFEISLFLLIHQTFSLK